mmetsp:Transcript_7257/g.16583  ORF Transcript_7257/g.16583 Transcript_7257/m.16583 type:complete len:228 (+) Transcript_7257:309-992(+)
MLDLGQNPLEYRRGPLLFFGRRLGRGPLGRGPGGFLSARPLLDQNALKGGGRLGGHASLRPLGRLRRGLDRGLDGRARAPDPPRALLGQNALVGGRGPLELRRRLGLGLLGLLLELQPERPLLEVHLLEGLLYLGALRGGHFGLLLGNLLGLGQRLGVCGRLEVGRKYQRRVVAVTAFRQCGCHLASLVPARVQGFRVGRFDLGELCLAGFGLLETFSRVCQRSGLA